MIDLVGTWRLVETRATDQHGRPMHPPYGPQPSGLVVFGSDGRMMAVLCDSRTSLPPDEPEREYNSYCGCYSFDGETLVTRVDAASDPVRLGGDQVRRVVYDSPRLTLYPPPRPRGDLLQHRELIWERIA